MYIFFGVLTPKKEYKKGVAAGLGLSLTTSRCGEALDGRVKARNEAAVVEFVGVVK